ncbi:hypothetical protein [Klenkia brasiliensis]|uniref:Uncharacterized protein n=1 Tax=Klenkia brasiliensis TaxID=333142 RepID=A0A1G7PGW0_9ACTN|nr:hypothetical protein [Klenkia brasiliensis]SDF85457.1 hypothetical protein SAMN05660324_1084 [Klenkia brasiliensis]
MTDDRARRAAERAFVRAHHPDVGGDPQVFAAGLAALRAGRHPRPAEVTAEVTVVATRRLRAARVLHRWRRARRDARRSTRLR